jgi:hypothetical protein
MDGYLYFIIFLMILFTYVHINSQYKRSEDLEIYEIDFTTNSQLQEICDVKQPILFSYSTFYPEFMTDITIDNVISKYGSSDIFIKENADYWISDKKQGHTNQNDHKDHRETGSTIKYYVPVDSFILPFQNSHKFMGSDTKSLYFSENNHEFVKETGIFRFYYNFNKYLKPNFTANTKYDICIGSQNAETPLRYHTDYRKFLIVSEGYIHVKMCPYRYSKNLHLIKDYDNFEYRSPVNVWNCQSKYQDDINRVQFLDFNVSAGNILSIPPYWFYSIKYSNDKKNLVSTISYNTVMNIVSILPEYGKYYLQQNSIETKVGKKMETEKRECHKEPVQKIIKASENIEPDYHSINNIDETIDINKVNVECVNNECSQETIENTIKKLTKNKLKMKTKTNQKEITNAGVYVS